MIPTFIFNADQRYTCLELNPYETLDISPSNILIGQSKYENLNRAINWAINNDEDIIYCVCEEYLIEELNLSNLEYVVRDIVAEGAYILYVHTRHEKAFPVNDLCHVVHEVYQVSSFLLTKPIYEDVKLFIDYIHKSQINIEWLDFLQMLNANRFAFSTSKLHSKPDKEYLIHIISAFRNASEFIKCNFDSIKSQTYQNYHLHYVDDASNDCSLELIPNKPFISKKINTDRKYALQNILDVLINSQFSDDDIICFIDADDYLPHKYVLLTLNQVYQQEETMITYGSMQNHNGNRNIGSKYTKSEFQNVRKSPWRVSHMRSFKYSIFKKYLESDPYLHMLKDSDGSILKMPYDMAILFPLMELVEYHQVIFLSHLTYKYRIHSLNDMHQWRGEQLRGEEILRSKNKLE
ncbi:glycosyltransferase family 2 protein [Pedobacter sp. MR2016-19]|uniref:glycosyltransferase family A protein n=1 Tax=Pedobacter sp. MR2016-19 TaxID=2780089 RepID=UPI001873884C|nr:glycosyltransferase family A protein [Pedobacter sp. MR2016-19]MBE5317744.1 glycosyltransferase family 2 protein [Pedobacter sp. MR2016-19]